MSSAANKFSCFGVVVGLGLFALAGIIALLALCERAPEPRSPQVWTNSRVLHALLRSALPSTLWVSPLPAAGRPADAELRRFQALMAQWNPADPIWLILDVDNLQAAEGNGVLSAEMVAVLPKSGNHRITWISVASLMGPARMADVIEGIRTDLLAWDAFAGKTTFSSLSEVVARLRALNSSYDRCAIDAAAWIRQCADRAFPGPNGAFTALEVDYLACLDRALTG